MRRRTRNAVWIAGIFLVSAPFSAILAMVLFPFWSWLETVFPIEAMGREGPSDWCDFDVDRGGWRSFVVGLPSRPTGRTSSSALS